MECGCVKAVERKLPNPPKPRMRSQTEDIFLAPITPIGNIKR